MHAYKLRIEFLWGHQSRIVGLSKTNPSYYYPPPTTILGAIAEPIAKEYRLGENSRTARLLLSALSRNLLAIGVKPVNALPIKYMDINRIIAIKKASGKTYPTTESPEEISKSFDAPARGKTIFASLDNEPPKIDVLLIFKKNTLMLGLTKIELTKDLLWEIHRIGSKESRVSVIDLIESENVNIEEGFSSTNYSFPLGQGIKVAEVIERKWVYESYISPYKLSPGKNILDLYLKGELVTYMVPLKIAASSEPLVKIEIRRPHSVYKIDFPSGEERVVGVSPS